MLNNDQHILSYEESLMKLKESHSSMVTESRYFYCLQQRSHGIDDVIKFINSVRTSHTYLQIENSRILKIKPIYNKYYYSDYRRYLDTAHDLICRIRSTLAGFKSLKAEMRPKGVNKKDVTAFDESPLFSGPYIDNMFGWEVYDEKFSKDLYDEIVSYLEDADKCIDCLVGMLTEEKDIKKDPERGFASFKYDYDYYCRTNNKTIKMVETLSPDLSNDFVKLIEEAGDIKKEIASHYHEYTHDTFNNNCLCLAVHEGQKVGLTKVEAMIWGVKQKEKVLRIRMLLDHLPELTLADPKRRDILGWHGMLSGKFVMHLLYWCGWDGTKDERILNYVTSKLEGTINVVKMGAVLREKRMLAPVPQEEINSEQEVFNARIDRFVDDIMSQQDSSFN